MRPLPSRSTPLLTAGLLLAQGGCASDGLSIAPPPVVEIAEVAEVAEVGETAGPAPVAITTVTDARTFTTGSLLAPIPTTRGDAGDPAWTRRVFGRRRSSARTLGGDRFTRDRGGVPALVRGALASGLSRAAIRVAPEDAGAPAGPRLDAVIDAFWIHEAVRSASARLVYHAEVTVRGPLPGFEAPVALRADGSIGAGAADGVLWRRAVERCLEALAEDMRRAAEAPAEDMRRAAEAPAEDMRRAAEAPAEEARRAAGAGRSPATARARSAP